MVTPAGFEPSATDLKGRCLNQLDQGAIYEYPTIRRACDFRPVVSALYAFMTAHKVASCKDDARRHAPFFEPLVEPGRLELPTSCLQNRRSSN